jgi:hypothetical protein
LNKLNFTFFMMQKILFFLIISLSFQFTYKIQAQQLPQNIESYSYTLLYNGEYQKLIQIGEAAISNGTDFFFLRYRLGIAYFNLANYRMAAYHLEKSLAYNSDDEGCLKYLYYSYLYSGRTTDASYLTTKMSDYVKSQIHYKTKYLSSIYVESGVSKSNNINKTIAADINGPLDIYGETDLNSDIFYGHIGLKHEISPRISIYHGFSYLNIDKRRIFSLFLRDTTFNYSAIQNEYYINADIQLKSGLKLTPAFHFIHVSSDNYNFSKDSLPYNRRISTSKLNVSNYVLSLALSKDYKKITTAIFASYSNLNNAKQIEGGLTVSYFPLGNLNLYTTSGLTFFFQKNSPGMGQDSTNEKRLIFDQTIGFKVLSKLWAEAGISIGEMQNYNEKNAFIVYNIPDKLKLKAGISLIYSLSEKIELSLRYQNLSKESIYYSQINPTTINSNTVNYQNNALIGGIKWKL